MDTILKFLKPFYVYAISKSNHSVDLVAMLLNAASMMFQTDYNHGAQNALKIFHHIVELLTAQVTNILYMYGEML